MLYTIDKRAFTDLSHKALISPVFAKKHRRESDHQCALKDELVFPFLIKKLIKMGP